VEIKLKRKATMLKSKFAKNIYSIWILLVALFLQGCDEQVFYHTYRNIPLEGWALNDTLYFTLSISDSTFTHYQYDVEIRHQENYKYKELILLLQHDQSNQLMYDTLHITTSQHHGQWIGKGIGKLFQTQISKGYISSADTCQFKIIHLMPDSLLIGINEVGIKLSALHDPHQFEEK